MTHGTDSIDAKTIRAILQKNTSSYRQRSAEADDDAKASNREQSNVDRLRRWLNTGDDSEPGPGGWAFELEADIHDLESFLGVHAQASAAPELRENAEERLQELLRLRAELWSVNPHEPGIAAESAQVITGKEALHPAMAEKPLAPTKSVPPKKGTPAWRILDKQEQGYTGEMRALLQSLHAQGAPRPYAHTLLQIWQDNPPPGWTVTAEGFDYPRYSGKRHYKHVSFKALNETLNSHIAED